MLKSFTVKGFKSLDEVTIELGLVNVFIGANGAGKSNLLEAIGLLSAAAYGRIGDAELLARGVRPGLPELYKASFHGYRIPAHIHLDAKSSNDAEFRVAILNPLRDPEPEWSYKTELLKMPGVPQISRSPATREARDKKRGYVALKSVELQDDDERSLLLTALQDYAIYDPDTPTLRGMVADPQTRAPVGLHGSRLPEAMRELSRANFAQATALVQDLADWVMAFGAYPSSDLPLSPSIPRQRMALKFRDRYMADKRDVFSAYEASEGVLYLLFGAVLALHPLAPKLLAIDNFDHALNPRAARTYTKQICDWLMEEDIRQFLLTSHNPLVLDGLPLLDDRIRLFAVDRTMAGKTMVTRVKVTEKIMAAAQNGIPLSQQWVMGNFGGLPKNV